MAKCGCSGSSCNCVVKAGANITVSGNGSSASPYIVATVATTAATVAELDTPTVDMTVTGGPAYVVSADVNISTAFGNILTSDATGLYVSGSSVTLVPLDTDTFDSVVIGGPNYTVSGNVRIDPVVGNLLTSSAAGLLVANPVIVLKTQARLLNATDVWTPGADVLGILTSVGFSVLSGTADLVDFNGTLSAGLPVTASAQWSALDSNTLTGPTSITANGGQTLVTWTEQ